MLKRSRWASALFFGSAPGVGGLDNGDHQQARTTSGASSSGYGYFDGLGAMLDDQHVHEPEFDEDGTPFEYVWEDGVRRRLPGTKGSPAAYSPMPAPAPAPVPQPVYTPPAPVVRTTAAPYVATTSTTPPPVTNAPPSSAFTAKEKVVAVPAVLAMEIPEGKAVSSLKDDTDFTTALCAGAKSAMQAGDDQGCRVADIKLAPSARRGLFLRSTKNGGNNHAADSRSSYYSRLLSNHNSQSLAVDFEFTVADDTAATDMISKVTASDMAAKIKDKTNEAIASNANLSSAGFSVTSVTGTENAAAAEVMEMDWGAMTGKEYKMIVCDKGNKIRFHWDTTVGSSPSMMEHDLHRINLESEYVACDFTHATNLATVAKKNTHTFSCDRQGMHFFSCQVTGHCTEAKQKLRVQVTDMSKTLRLRETLNTDPKYNAKHWTYAMVMSGYFVDADFNGGFATDAVASTAQYRLWCVLPHCKDLAAAGDGGNGALASADWFPEAANSVSLCEAFVEADIGYAYRKRPTPNYAKAEEYYDKALAIKPDFCAALSYKTGMYVQMGDASRAHGYFPSACSSCGDKSLDMEMLKAAYDEKGWKYPCGTDCSGSDCIAYQMTIAPSVGGSTAAGLGTAGAGSATGSSSESDGGGGMSTMTLVLIAAGAVIALLGCVAAYYIYTYYLGGTGKEQGPINLKSGGSAGAENQTTAIKMDQGKANQSNAAKQAKEAAMQMEMEKRKLQTQPQPPAPVESTAGEGGKKKKSRRSDTLVTPTNVAADPGDTGSGTGSGKSSGKMSTATASTMALIVQVPGSPI
eukprot:g12508.t1